MRMLGPAILALLMALPLPGRSAPITYTVEGVLGLPWDPLTPEALAPYYSPGTVVRGNFTLDDEVGLTRFPDANWFFGAFSGEFAFGSNLVKARNSFAANTVLPYGTELTMLGGNRWNTGGVVEESLRIPGLTLAGVQLRFSRPEILPLDTPVRELLASATPESGSFALVYSDGTDASLVTWWQVTQLRAVESEIPEPGSGMLLATGVLLVAARRRRAPSR